MFSPQATVVFLGGGFHQARLKLGSDGKACIGGGHSKGFALHCSHSNDVTLIPTVNIRGTEIEINGEADKNLKKIQNQKIYIMFSIPLLIFSRRRRDIFPRLSYQLSLCHMYRL